MQKFRKSSHSHDVIRKQYNIHNTEDTDTNRSLTYSEMMNGGKQNIKRGNPRQGDEIQRRA